jgi:hypothetical protein
MRGEMSQNLTDYPLHFPSQLIEVDHGASLSTLDRLAQVSPVNVTKTALLTASSSQQKLLFKRTALKPDGRRNPFPTGALKSLIEMDRGGRIIGRTDHRAYQEPIFPIQGLSTRSLAANQASQETEKSPFS